MTGIDSVRKAASVFTRTFSYLHRSSKPGHDLEQLKTDWALETLASMGVVIDQKGQPQTTGPILLVGNHISYLDIPMLMLSVPGVSFLAKSEIRRWPVIGRGADVMGTTFVKRQSPSDRSAARRRIGEALGQGAKIALFPSGTTCIDESKPWRLGAFEIAHELGIPLQPFRISYEPLRSAAFIDRDIFPLQLFRLAQAGRTEAFIEFHEPVQITDPAGSAVHWQKWTQEALGTIEGY